MKKVKIGVIGFGTVGAGVASCLLENGDVISSRTGIDISLAKVADLDTESDRGVELPPGVLTNDAEKLIDEVDVVVELIGGTGTAKDLILRALSAGKPVVTANKALLAEHGSELFAAAEQSSADIYYEASVAGGVPVVKALREGLVGNRVGKIVGIFNGTCNYILTRMEAENADFDTVLDEAGKLGYAEADPSLDIDGVDTAHKIAIMASLAYGEWFGMSPVSVEGIRGIDLLDLKFALELGYRVKLLGIADNNGGDVQMRVHPSLVPLDNMLADVSGVFNGVLVKGDYVGDLFFHGRGAGRDATASAVVADIVDVALNLKLGSHRRVPAFRIGRQFAEIAPLERTRCRYYTRMQVMDKPGVVAAVSTVLGNHGISISSILQKEGQSADNVSLIIVTHAALEANMSKAILEIETLDCVKGSTKLFRIEDV
jgi:homoserine dehydrogenase